MELVPKTKYTHFRSESLSSTDETNSNPSSFPPSSPATPLTPSPGLPSSLSSSSLTPILPPSSPRPAENSPTTLCSFFPRMGSLRLGVSATLLPGLKASSRPQQPQAPVESSGDDRSNSSSSPPLHHPVPPLTAPSPPPRPPLQDMNRLGVAPRRARVEGGQLGGDEWTRHGSFVNKPTRGWLHSDTVVSTTGVSYTVRVSKLKYISTPLFFHTLHIDIYVCVHPVFMFLESYFLPLLLSNLCSVCPMGLSCRKCLMLMCCLPVSWAVHGLRGGAAVDASAGLQHQNSGHQVRPHTALQFLSLRPATCLVSALVCASGREKVKVWLDLEISDAYTYTRHSLLIHVALCARLLSVPPLLSFAFLLLSASARVSVFALSDLKLECSGILVVSLWFP